MSSSTNIRRGNFRNPCPDLTNVASKKLVDTLLSTVSEASKKYGDPTQEDYELAAQTLDVIQNRVFEQRSTTLPQLVEARIRLTVKASLETHCLTAFPYENALEAAQRFQLQVEKLDEEYEPDEEEEDEEDYEEAGKFENDAEFLQRYPLLGLVFSVKDCIHVQGLPTTLGCSLRAGHDEAATASIVDKLIDLGGIMIAKTTAPQLMMSNITQSPLWGTTRSPIKSAKSTGSPENEFQVGGSSGGEASLVKMGGSHLGIGTDMGGSIRQPACLNELYGFKFTSKPDNFRWKLPQDYLTGLPHTTVPATAPGFMTRDIVTLNWVVESLSGLEHRRHYDPDSGIVSVGHETLQEYEEDQGNNPRIFYTAQSSSSEVSNLVGWLIKSIETGHDLLRPTQSSKLGEIDVSAWAEAWTEYAKQHGFDDARAMLADDPLIYHTLFDESRLNASAADKDSWRPDAAKLALLKAAFLRQAEILHDIDAPSKGDDKTQNIIFITPTYVLGSPVQNKAFLELDDAGESEAWCQIFNLLDWPSISIPLANVPRQVRQEWRSEATRSSEWARYLPSSVEKDPIRSHVSGADRGDDDGGDEEEEEEKKKKKKTQKQKVAVGSRP